MALTMRDLALFTLPRCPCSADARAEFLELAHNLSRRAFHGFRDAPLRVGAEACELLAEVAVHDILDGVIVRAVREVVSPAERGELLAHVHLELRRKVDILAGGEGEHGSDSAADGAVDEHLEAARLERRLGHPADGFADVELCDGDGFVCGAVERALRRREPSARGVVLHLLRDVLRQARDEDVAKLVAARHRVVVEHHPRRQPPWARLVRKDVHHVVLRLVPHKVEPFLDVPDVDALALRLDGANRVGKVFVLALEQQLLFAELVQAERAPNAAEEPSLEPSHRERHVVHGRFVEELHRAAILADEAVHADEAALLRARIELQPHHCAHHEHNLREVARERRHAARKSRLVPIEFVHLQRLVRLWVEQTDARRPPADGTFWRPALLRR
mmetsp:Transcript_14057/g.46181  ORF Transcript_14057/g.46181 Transcript_14057/m.46181 type:complete len:390 (-) Transcript_14057:39-1208(-)